MELCGGRLSLQPAFSTCPCVGRFFCGRPRFGPPPVPAAALPRRSGGVCGPKKSQGRRRSCNVCTSFSSCGRLLALSAPAADAFPRTVVDDIGQEIYLEAPPQRILSVGLAMDNILLSVTDP